MSFSPLRIVIPGGSGQVGRILARHFYELGHDVTVLSRNPQPCPWKVIAWNAQNLGDWARVLDGSAVVINLAGRSVNCRYNASNRRQIVNSRTITTGLIGQAIAQTVHPPPLWLNASTATIYCHSLDSPMDEAAGDPGGSQSNSPARWQFSIEVAKAWERALFVADTPHTRRIALRSSLIMSPDKNGAFDLLLRLVRWGLGGAIASGSQYVSWIHDVDFIRAVEFLIAHPELSGAVNVTSPAPVPNRKFMNDLRQSWCTSYVGLPTPSWLLPLGSFLLRTEPELVLKSRRVIPRRLLDAGFDFHFPNWRSASQDLIARWRHAHLS
ncbi:MAG TPA: TIGR01777 family oxidoreductase [Bryobacteraceae bacterium]|jgi:hypothetical protein|nr:TIGR01777 family oxidoreductase [Bryobacteraceae bacterium]